jgi:ABC-type Mn2+/Zn2+ transport system permease subunit
MEDGDGGTSSSSGRGPPSIGDFFWVGTACAISVVAGLGLGYLLDQVTHTTPWLTFAGLAFGVFCAVVIVVRQLRRFL